MLRESNIFDEVHDSLDQNIFKNIIPRRRVLKFVADNFYKEMGKYIPNPEQYFTLFLTGSLTTYQYNETSDMDITVFPNYTALIPIFMAESDNEVRKHLIQIVIQDLDGTFVPGTRHPLQHFVELPGLFPQDKFKPGIRSAYDIENHMWFVTPEKSRSHNVSEELPVLYQRAQEMADKMENMLDHDPVYAKELYKQIHKKRTLDEENGLGDFSEGNIIYKFLAYKGLFDRLRSQLGIHIAKLSADNLALENVQVIYDFEKDRILLGTSAANIPNTKVIGEYDGKNLHLYSTGPQFINANYLKRLWFWSFPTRPLENIYFDNKHLPTRNHDR